jgi:cold shock protein
MNGNIKFFNEKKAFGFIKSEDGKEYFFHISGLTNPQARLNENDSVTFDVEEGDRGAKAVNVAKTE